MYHLGSFVLQGYLIINIIVLLLDKKNVVNFRNTCIHESHPALINDGDRLTCLIK